MPTPVDILLATYNGARFVTAQIESLRAQTHTDWRLWVRDDGSSDETLRILGELAVSDPRIRLLPADGKRLGATGSFARLLANAPAEACYLMFCDQDDIWLPEKIEKTLCVMQIAEHEHSALPILAHSDLRVVDADLKQLHPSFWEYGQLCPQRRELRHLVIQNNVTGCAMMINRALKEKLTTHMTEEVIMHDWWLALVAAAFGRIVLVNEALMLYRQHSTNTLGAQNLRKFTAPQKLLHPAETRNRIRDTLVRTQHQALGFLRTYEKMLSPQQTHLLRQYGNLSAMNSLSRRLCLFRLGTFKAGWKRNLGLLLAI